MFRVMLPSSAMLLLLMLQRASVWCSWSTVVVDRFYRHPHHSDVTLTSRRHGNRRLFPLQTILQPVSQTRQIVRIDNNNLLIITSASR